MHGHREPRLPRCLQDAPAGGHREHPGLAEHVAPGREARPRDGGNHVVAERRDIPVGMRPMFGRDFVRAQEGGDDAGAAVGLQAFDHPELLQLGVEIEPVSRLDLHRRRTVRPERVEARAGQQIEVVLGPVPDVPHRLEDASARRGDRLVSLSERATAVIVEPRGPEHAVRVRVDEPGIEDATDFLTRGPGMRGRELLVGTDGGDTTGLEEDGRSRQHFNGLSLVATPRPRRAPAGHDGASTHEQGAQSRASRMGSRTCSRSAVAIASAYPASAWRATPIPGSLVRTRSSRRAASGVPSATITCPAWRELPMPTPPPWWNETQDAPDAVFRSALRMAQSAMASDPSRMASVSRKGEATEPVSR